MGNRDRSGDGRRPFWLTSVPQHFDIARLRPRHLPKGQRFESKGDAYALSERNEAALRRTDGTRNRQLADALRDCRNFDVVCGLPSCPICAGYYRRWLTWQSLRMASKVGDGAKVVTLYLDEFPAGELRKADIAKLHTALRARLRRCGFSGSMIIGGTEVRFDTAGGSWLLHVHLLVANVTDDAITNLLKLNKRIARAVQVQNLADPVQQLSYLQKFVTFHRPGQQTSKRRARAYPLPQGPLLELLGWFSKHQLGWSERPSSVDPE